MKPLLITSGEPAGVGPDLCLELAKTSYPLVVLVDKVMLAARAKQLGVTLVIEEYDANKPLTVAANHLTVLSLPCAAEVISGTLNVLNVPYVIDMLTLAVKKCLLGEFSALVTAPIHKGVINQAGIRFTGHTEFFAECCQAKNVVMMLVNKVMRVALVTMHLPLKDVSNALTQELIVTVIAQLNDSLKQDFAINSPRIFVAGLNPHAGEGGYLGQEEIQVITPAIDYLRGQGMQVFGPFSADTLFIPQQLVACDVIVAMYHDQGLPVLKYSGFDNAVNVTLGLPIVRTSVDHGTALELAGTGKAHVGSLLSAIEMAMLMVKNRAA